jgi:hypothetical protein
MLLNHYSSVAFAVIALFVAQVGLEQGESITIPQPIGDNVMADKLNEWFAQLQKDGKELRLPDLPVGALKTGHVGTLPYDFDPAKPSPFVKTEVLRVMDDENYLLFVHIYALSQNIARGEFGKPVRPITPVEIKGKTIWVRSSSRDRDVGDRSQLRGAWKVAGTQDYESADGKVTVHVIEPIRIVIPK